MKKAVGFFLPSADFVKIMHVLGHRGAGPKELMAASLVIGCAVLNTFGEAVIVISPGAEQRASK